MYLTKLKTVLTDAVRQTFDANYPVTEFRGIHTSIEFPREPQHYPGIWVDYNPIGSLRVAGIGHIEFDEEGGSARKFTRWRFQGEASFTVVAMTSLERDRLHDEMIRVFAFGRETAATSEFRDYIEQNVFLATQFDWDEIAVRGMANTLGTPWQTEDMIYEVELAMECFGEFISDSQDQTLVPLSEVRVIDYHDQEEDPTTSDDGAWQ
jgi:hypothetical protein